MYLRKYGTICGFKISVTMSKKDKEYDEDGLVIRPNKTALKKEREEVKAFAEKLLALPKDNYALLPIDEILKNALLEGKRLKDNPLRRHLAFVVRLIVEQDFAAIQESYDKVCHPYRNDKNKIHQIEAYRERIIDNDASVYDELLEKFSDINIQQLRQLARNVKKERAKQEKDNEIRINNGQKPDNSPVNSEKQIYQILFKSQLR